MQHWQRWSLTGVMMAALMLAAPVMAQTQEGSPQLLVMKDGRELLLRGTRLFLRSKPEEAWAEAPDGEYTLQDGYVLVVTDGEIPVDRRTPETIVQEAPVVIPDYVKQGDSSQRPAMPNIPKMTSMPQGAVQTPEGNQPAAPTPEAYVPSATDAKPQP